MACSPDPRHTYDAGVTTHLVRPRRPADLPALVEVLAQQQARSGYPHVWPRPGPVVDFVCRTGELAAWTAELDGAPVGHVSLLEVGPDEPAALTWVRATGSDRGDLACVSALFVAHPHWSRGIGVRLLEAACDWARDRDKVPCLDVVPEHTRALDLYRRKGWREVGTLRPDWLRADAGPVLLLVAGPHAGPHAELTGQPAATGSD